MELASIDRSPRASGLARLNHRHDAHPARRWHAVRRAPCGLPGHPLPGAASLSPRSSVSRTESRCHRDRRARPHADPTRCPAGAAPRLRPQTRSGPAPRRPRRTGRPSTGGPFARTEIRLHSEMNLHAIEGDEAIAAAVPLAGAETKPAVVGKGSGQVTNREDRGFRGQGGHSQVPIDGSRMRPMAPATGRAADRPEVDEPGALVAARLLCLQKERR